VPPPPERMPQTWKGTYRGDRDYVTHLRRVADARRDLEARQPVLAHEGRFEHAPLGAGDPLPGHPHETTGKGPGAKRPVDGEGSGT
jgi:hypothetical protein